jgi:uridine kinase
MKGDIIVLEEHHKKAASTIIPEIINKINNTSKRYIITVAGESGSGKSETATALSLELKKYNLKSIILGQDDYFVLPPKSNDKKRRKNPEWLGPHIEVKLDILQKNINDAIIGIQFINKPIIDYDKNSIEEEKIDLNGIKIIIAEGTYTSLLRNIDTKIFISRNRLDTLEHRKKRNRGNEVNDPFIEQLLITEHKIIAGHKNLADFIITKDYNVIVID